MFNETLLMILIPLLILDLGMRAFCVYDIYRSTKNEIKLRFEPIVWYLIVLLVNFGWVAYLIFGKIDE